MYNTKLKSKEGHVYLATIEKGSEFESLAWDTSFVVLGEEKKDIGTISLENIQQMNQRAVLNVSIDDGIDADKYIQYTQEAINTMIDYSHNYLNLNNLMLVVPVNSIKLIHAISKSHLLYLGKSNRTYNVGKSYFCDELYFNITKDLMKCFNSSATEKERTILLNSIKKLYNDIDVNQTRYIINDSNKPSSTIGDSNLLLIKSGLSKLSDKEVQRFCSSLNSKNISSNLGMYKTNWNLMRTRNKLEKADYLMMLDGEFVGYINANNISDKHRKAELEVLILPEQQSKGYGKQAVSAYTKELFTKRGIINLNSNVFDFNEKSIRLMRSLLFDEIGSRSGAYYTDGEFNDLILFNKHNDSVNGYEYVLSKKSK